MRRTGRTIALFGLACVPLAGCAQPGQLGHPTPAGSTPTGPALTGPASTGPAPPPTPAADGIDVTGRLSTPVSVTTPGPAVFSVTTTVLAPGESVGWLSRPGTETAIVRSGRVTLSTDRDCGGTGFAAGDALFVPDARSQLLRNDGTVPAELVVTTLLAPGLPDHRDIPDPC